MRRISTNADIAEGLERLCSIDPRLAAVRTAAGEVPLRLVEPGFESLVSIIVSQQISRASADAIHGRLRGLVDPLGAEALLAASELVYREAGLSRPKQRTLLAAASAVQAGLDLDGLCRMDAAEAMSRLTGIPGVGPWTAQIYLLFAGGHPDIFPSGDVALQSAVGEALGIAPRPGAKALAEIAESWAPWRGTAARLFWAYYRERRGREGVLFNRTTVKTASS